MNWDDYFLTMCDTVALKSKDQSTKLGAIIVGPKNRVLGTGYNSYPRGVVDRPERQRRPEKYKWFEHAERNAIYCAAGQGHPLEGSRLYCQWLPCPDCARGIINVGIDTIIVPSFEVPERWLGDMRVSVQMLTEAQVMIRKPNQPVGSWEAVMQCLK